MQRLLNPVVWRGLEVQAAKNVILIDGWAMSPNGRIGTLVGGLRRKMHDLMLVKFATQFSR